MLQAYGNRRTVRALGTPVYGAGIVRTARTLAAAAKKLAPYARAAGAKSTVQRKLGMFVGKPKVRVARRQTASTVGQEYGGGNDWTQSRSKVGYKKKPTLQRLTRMMNASMTNKIYRFQNITNFDTNSGGVPISNWQFASGEVTSPVHYYDLTSFPNTQTNVSPTVRLQWASTLSTADLQRFAIPGQFQDGSSDVNGVWIPETQGGALGTGISNTINARSFQHNWTDVRINFYGPRKRTTKFEVMFFRIKDENANPEGSAVSNANLKELQLFLERPCIYSNIQTYTSNVAKKIQMIKKFTYFVSAGQTTDVDTTVGKIKEARIFLRHDKMYNLDWRHTGAQAIPHEQADGLDFVQDSIHHDRPWYSSRVYMCIRAFAPERTTGKVGEVVDATKDPSYDIIIRNSVSLPA